MPWTPNVWHYVVYLGYEESEFQSGPGDSVDTIRYYFKLENGKEMPIDVRSTSFGSLMSDYRAGDRLKIKRTQVGDKKYKYHVIKLGHLT